MTPAKPSRAGAAFGRLTAATAAHPVPSGESPTPTATPRHRDVSTPGHPDTATPREPVSRFTVRLWSEDEADRWEVLRMAMRRELRRPVDKAAIVRALVTLAATDETVRAALVRALRAQDAPGPGAVS